jgi:hypothetical protein
MTAALLPVEFTPPLQVLDNPYGLDVATHWTESREGDALRWLPSGVQFRMRTHRAPGAFGVWEADWCASLDELTAGDEKTGNPYVDDDPFTPMTLWSFDRLQECGNLSATDRAEVLERVRQTFALRAPPAVETEFATRLLTVARTPTATTTLVEAVAHLEESFAATGATGSVHARPGLLAVAEHNRLIVRDPVAPGVLLTPAGHRWVFGGGYPTPLADTLVGTSLTYGWRDEIAVRDTVDHTRNQFVAVAEQSVVVGYENASAQR